MNILLNPLSYFALILIFSGFYFIFSKQKAKIGGSVLMVVPWMTLISRSFNLLFGLNSETREPVELPENVKKLFGTFFVLVGLALLIMLWTIYQV